MKQEGVAVEETYTGNTMDAGNPVTTIVTWEIQEGRENSLKHGDMKLITTKFPGHLGVNLIVPSNESREYTVIFRFDTYEHLRTWQESDVRRDLLKRRSNFKPLIQLTKLKAVWLIGLLLRKRQFHRQNGKCLSLPFWVYGLLAC